MENYLLTGGKRVFAGLFNNKNNAEKGYFELKAQGYLAGEINVLMSKETQIQYYSDSPKESSTNDVRFRGIADDVSSFGTNLKIPWPGLVVSGPLEADFDIRNAKGSLAITEALIKAGIPKDEMVRYFEGLKDGKILITVYAHHGHNDFILSQNQNNYILETAI